MKKLLISLFILFSAASNYAQLTCNMWLSDGSGGFKSGNTYGPGDVVYVTGAGLSASFPAVGALYIIHDHDANDGAIGGYPLEDVLSPLPNVLQSYLLGGAYIDEIIAIGPMPEGDYDIVIDLNGNGVYDVNTDCYYGVGTNVAFRVRGTFIPAWKLTQLANLKADALVAALEASDMREANDKLWQLISYVRLGGDISKILINGKGLKEVMQLLFKKKVVEEYILGPLSYTGLVLKTGKTITTLVLKVNELHYHGIAADPPDYDYYNMAPTEAAQFWYPDEIHPYLNARANLINSVAIENIALDGIFHSMEKVQGAEADREDAYIRLQSIALKKYISLWKEAKVKRHAAIDSMKVYLLANNMNDTIDKQAIQANANRILNTGFKQSELDNYKQYGITSPAQLDSVKSIIASFDTSGFYTGTTSDYLDNLKSFYDAIELTLDSMVIRADVIINNITPIIRDHWPSAYITYSGTPTLGSGIQLNANDSSSVVSITSYAWDTDKDSLFDNGTASAITFTPNRIGLHLVSLKITNALGNVDYAYAILDVQPGGNQPPVINAYSPVAEHTVIDGSQAAVTYSVSAIDPESNPLTYRWILNGDTITNSSPSRNIMADTAITNAITNCAVTFNTLVLDVYDNVSAYKTGHVWTMLVNPIPESSLVDKDTITCQSCSITLNPASSISTSTYLWSTGASSDTLAVNTPGLYTVTVTANGCSVVDSTRVYYTGGSTGLENASEINTLVVYPNPSMGEITIDYSIVSESAVSLELYNTIGQSVIISANNKQPAGNYKIVFDPRTSALGADNIYLLRLIVNNDVIVKRVVLLD